MKKIFLFLLFSAAVALAQPQMEDLAMLPPSDNGSMIDNILMPPTQDELPPPGDDMMMPRFAGRRIMNKLNLTSEQEKQFGKLQSEMQKEQIALHSKMQSLRIDLRDLFREDNPDQRKIESKLVEIDNLQTQTRKNHLDFWFNVNTMLTPDQQKVWKEHRMIHGEGMGMRGDRTMREKGGRHGGFHRNMQECPQLKKQ